MKVLRKFSMLLALVAVVGVGTITIQAQHATPAHATVSCYGSNCTDKDPTTTVGTYDGILCNHDAFKQQELDKNGAYVQNWWSQSCNANWTVGQAKAGDSIVYIEQWLCAGQVSGIDCSTTVQYYDETVPGYSCLQPSVACHHDIPVGTTHWYVNMVNGNVHVASLVYFASGFGLMTTYQ
ncbi:MAG TPA: hypothetical protein VFU32_10275 [Ktedonobacterales bacterium]|nr:hypothetical protein [Ktedonobacterales bacterium]